ncbi:hypothetical protein [Oceanicola sp. S124]|uniref:hypothetical protein n=1 Tax=Oceanicola sp. S124 TaxID=1042378 RepID=UPI0006818495|nr:hypothetical protein [Oceanicola sp. S124]
MKRRDGHLHSLPRLLRDILMVLLLTLLTQVGGLAWMASRLFRRSLPTFLLIYVALSAGAAALAPTYGRAPVNCLGDGALQMQSWTYCVLNRNFISPELAQVLEETAAEMNQRHPGTITLLLDANFPFFNGFPLLPHLSHDDGRKADLAFYYRDETGYLPGKTRSPIGYFAFEEGPTRCPDRRPTLRWDMAALQPLWPDYALDRARNRAVLAILAEDRRVGKIFVEPHVARDLSVTSEKIRFQGCRAARHDDHIHLQLP